MNRAKKARGPVAILVFLCMYVVFDISELLEVPSKPLDKYEYDYPDVNRRLESSPNPGGASPGKPQGRPLEELEEKPAGKSQGFAPKSKESTVSMKSSSPKGESSDPRPSQESVNYDSFYDSFLDPPPGFPWHRWGDWKSSSEMALLGSHPELSSADDNGKELENSSKLNAEAGQYPLNTVKFLSVLSKHGRKQSVSSMLYDLIRQHNRGQHSSPRLSGVIKVFLLRNGTLMAEEGGSNYWDSYALNAKGYHIDFYNLLRSALEMAKSLEHQDARMKLITEGDFPIIFDNFDYPWCGDDLVPVFRTNLIQSPEECQHAWPGLSLMYLTNTFNQQLRKNTTEWHSTFAANEETFPWDGKIRKAVWRGRMTGYTKLYKNWVTPRMRLLWKAEYYSKSMDVKFIPWSENPKRNWGRIPAHHIKHKMNPRDYMRYRAILDIDGNGWSSRLGNLLCMNSVVLKVRPQFVNYFEKELVPWKHYVPVREDLRDLGGKLHYVLAQENQNKMKEIIKHANEFCSWKFTYEQQTRDFLWTLLSYAELLRNAPDFYESWKNDYFAYHLPKLHMAQPHSKKR